jgi:transcriptional regulator with XRE-family HTH domain
MEDLGVPEPAEGTFEAGSVTPAAAPQQMTIGDDASAAPEPAAPAPEPDDPADDAAETARTQTVQAEGAHDQGAARTSSRTDARSWRDTDGSPLPRNVSVAIGRQIKQYRILRGLSQQKLAEKIGLTFQQIQKYEWGTNRIVADRLVAMADALDVPVTTFFEATGPGDGNSPELTTRHLNLIRYYESLSSLQQDRVYALIRSIAGAESGEEDPGSGRD